MNKRLLLCLIGGLFLTQAFGQAGTTSRVSVSTLNGQGNDQSEWSAISFDGRFVAFHSFAANLVEGDTNSANDVFVHDRLTGQTSRVSVSSTGAQGDGYSDLPSLSADGRFIAFVSTARNLVSNTTSFHPQIFVHDRQTGETTCSSISSAGLQGNGMSLRVSISGDGRYVAFGSQASNLVTGDTNGGYDFFVHDRQTGLLERISVSSSGEQGNSDNQISQHGPSISADGRYVVFDSSATNLVANDTNGKRDVFLRDLWSDTTTRVSVSDSGEQGNKHSGYWGASISTHGEYVAFASDATNIVPNDTNDRIDIFVLDRTMGQTTCASVSNYGEHGSDSSFGPSISSDGRFVAFASSAVNFGVGDTNNEDDAFVHDRLTGQTSRVSVSSAGVQGNNSAGGTRISGDGRWVVFTSAASNLVPNDTNAVSDVFVHQYRSQVTYDVAPSAFTVSFGFDLSGGLASLFDRDDDRLGILPNDDLVAQVEIAGTSPIQNPSLLSFTFEGSVTRPGLSQRIRLRNYASGTFFDVDHRLATTSDSTIHVVIRSNPSRFVGPSGALLARVTWNPINDDDPAQDGWLHSIDLVHWMLE